MDFVWTVLKRSEKCRVDGVENTRQRRTGWRSERGGREILLHVVGDASILHSLEAGGGEELWNCALVCISCGAHDGFVDVEAQLLSDGGYRSVVLQRMLIRSSS